MGLLGGEVGLEKHTTPPQKKSIFTEHKQHTTPVLGPGLLSSVWLPGEEHVELPEPDEL